MTTGTFICERCYHDNPEDPSKAVKKDRRNMYSVCIAVWSKDSQELRHRIEVRRLCKIHADEFAQKVKEGDVPIAMQQAML
jgi:hypothetical protein